MSLYLSSLDPIEDWVKDNYDPIVNMADIPEGIDLTRCCYFTFDEGVTQYGPVSKEDLAAFIKKERLPL